MRAAGKRGRGRGMTDSEALPALVEALAQAKVAFASAPRALDGTKPWLNAEVALRRRISTAA